MTAGAATIVDPATEDVVGVVLHTTADEVDTAIARARAAAPPGHRDREPVGELQRLGAVPDAVRRLGAVRPRARARPRALDAFTEVENVFLASDDAPS